MKPQNIMDFEVHKKFTEALKDGSYIIMITRHDRKRKRNHHYAVWSHFPTDDIMPSVEQMNRLIIKQLEDKFSADGK